MVDRMHMLAGRVTHTGCGEAIMNVQQEVV
jgi:hypothetical protein